MPSLNTNVASLYASKNLMTAQSKMADSVERLSSGMRINRAKDDAAGLGIANSLSSQINGANQGIKNLNDGISIVQTAEGAISEASDLAQRILTLAAQAKNGTMSSDNRKSVVNEMKAILSSINGMSARAKYGDKELLSVSTTATASTAKFQISASAISSDSISLTNDAFRNIGAGTTATTEATTFTITSALTEGQAITIGGRTITAGTGGATIAQVAQAFVTGLAVGGTSTTGAVLTTAGGSTNTLTTGWTVSNAGSTYSEGLIAFTSTTASTDMTDISSSAAAFSTTGNPGLTYNTVQGGAQASGQASLLNTAITTLSTHLDAGSIESTIQSDLTAIQDRANDYITLLNTQRRTKLNLQYH